MLKLISICRRVSNFIAYASGLYALGALVYAVFALVMNSSNLEAPSRALVQVGVKSGLFGVVWLFFFGVTFCLGKLETALASSRFSPDRHPTAIAASSTSTRRIPIKPIAVICLAGVAIGLLAWVSNRPTETTRSIAPNCTSVYDAFQRHLPNFKGASLLEVAEAFRSVLKDPDSPEAQISQIENMLLECRWWLALEYPGSSHYVDSSRLLLFPNKRRMIPVLHDYYAPKSFNVQDGFKEYHSVTEMVLVGCEDKGILYLFEKSYSLWFGLGSEVSSRGGGGGDFSSIQSVPLRPTESESFNRELVEVICAI